MKRLLSLAFLVFISLSPLFAQSSVWKVSRGDEILYVGGTIHVLRPGDFPLPAEFDHAYERSDTLVFETDLDGTHSDAFGSALASRMFLPAGETLFSALSPSVSHSLQRYLASTGYDVGTFGRLRPWAAVLMLTQSALARNGIDQHGVDEHYSRRAAAEGKERRYLETPLEQIELITRIGEGEGDAVILQTLRELETIPHMVGWLVRDWREGRTERMERELVEAMREESPGMYRDILENRNRGWIPKLVAMMREGKRGFVLVGAMHLVGRNGLLALFREQGYRVIPVNE